MQKRYVYILLSDDCQVLVTETSLKKLIEKHIDTYQLLSYRYMLRRLAPLKESRKQFRFRGLDGNRYRLTASRIQ